MYCKDRNQNLSAWKAIQFDFSILVFDTRSIEFDETNIINETAITAFCFFFAKSDFSKPCVSLVRQIEKAYHWCSPTAGSFSYMSNL